MLEYLLERPGVLTARDVPCPALQPGDVLLKVQALTLCGSDVRVFTGEKTGGVRWPAVLGHEFSGEVVDAAGGAGSALLGTRCAVMPWISCGGCPACLRGDTNLCADMEIFGYQIPGAMAEYVRIPEAAVAGGNLVPLPADVPPERGALAEPLACVYHGHRRSRVAIDSTVLILGAGPIGLFHTKLALAAGARVVVVSEPDAARRAYAAGLPRTLTVDPGSQDLREVVRGVTAGQGVDSAIVCVGVPDLVASAIDCTRGGGLINLFAGFGKYGMAEVDLNAVHYHQLDVVGNADATVSEYRTAVSLLATGAVEVESMVTHRFPLDRAGEALEAARSGSGIKVAIVG